jgi:hypothetical protein
MKRRILGYCLSIASAYISMNYFTKLFIELMQNFTISVI